MYLLITEDGYSFTATDVTDELVAADAGIIDIFDVSDASNITQYYSGKWNAVATSIDDAMGED